MIKQMCNSNFNNSTSTKSLLTMKMSPHSEIPCSMGVSVREQEREQELLFTELSFKIFI